MYPEAGEASICRRTHPGQSDRVPSPAEQARRRDRNEQRNAQRAKAHVRRYVRANRMRFLWTLTYATPARTMADAGADVDAMLRRLRETKGRLPLVAVLEPHPGGHGYHVHFATDRRLSVELIRRLWGKGHVWVGNRDNLAGRTPPRKLAAYLAKYVAKSLEGHEDNATVSGRAKGQHRYRLTEGFSPQAWKTTVLAPQDGYSLLHLLYGQEDQAYAFSVADDGVIDAWWFSYPDTALHPPPRPEVN